MRQRTLTHRFVETIPDELEERVLYVSVPYATASHRCCCGCGLEVVTPLSPTDWSISFNGESVSLDPSIGNWSFPCRSHYWITNGMVEWSFPWSQPQIDEGRDRDQARKRQHCGERPARSADRAVWSSVKRWLGL